MPLSKDDIFSANDGIIEKVETPEWGPKVPHVHIRTISGSERDGYEIETFEMKGKDVSYNRVNARARLLVRCIADENGSRVFGDSDVEQLGNRSAKVLDRLYTVAQRLNGLSKADVEELVKN